MVRAGKARYIGASSMFAWQGAKAQNAAGRHGWTRFVSMQDHYNKHYVSCNISGTAFQAACSIRSGVADYALAA